jgi:protoheme IX farnesyltransferase
MNIVIGGAAGAVPPLVGWAAVTHTVGAPALGLFALIFLWTPPHFWALALMADTDYHKAGIPMLPNVRGIQHTKVQIFVYYDHPGRLVARVDAARRDGTGGTSSRLRSSERTLHLRRVEDYCMEPDSMPLARVRLSSTRLLYLALMCAAMVVDRIIAR